MRFKSAMTVKQTVHMSKKGTKYRCKEKNIAYQKLEHFLHKKIWYFPSKGREQFVVVFRAELSFKACISSAKPLSLYTAASRRNKLDGLNIEQITFDAPQRAKQVPNKSVHETSAKTL